MVDSTVSQTKRRLVLHFDLNGTLLMHDNAMGLKSTEYAANVIARAAWGRISCTLNDQGEKQYRWDLAHDQLTMTKPDCPNLLANLPPVESVEENSFDTYYRFVGQTLPVLSERDAESREQWVQRNEQRSALFLKFCAPGG